MKHEEVGGGGVIPPVVMRFFLSYDLSVLEI